MGAMNGNGTKGKSKGKSQARRADPNVTYSSVSSISLFNLETEPSGANYWADDRGDAALVQEIKAAMPIEAQLRSMPKLVAHEWNAPVVPYPELSASGGISLVPKHCVASVIRQVGFTAQAVAICITQAPSTLGLESYPHSQVDLTILVREGPENREVRVQRLVGSARVLFACIASRGRS